MKSLVDDVLVAIPWMGDDPFRRAALGWVTQRWVAAGYRPTLGMSIGDTWVKAEAVRSAIAGSTADILVITDADVWCDGVEDAIRSVRQGAIWSRPHRLVWRLSPESTRQVLAGATPQQGMELDPSDPMTRLPGRVNQGYGAVDGGGIIVVRRDIYEDVPLDPRYRGWGREDTSWALAVDRLHGGPVRHRHDLWHLYHPPQERLTRNCGSGDDDRLTQRYSQARTPEAMRRLVDEAKEATLC